MIRTILLLSLMCFIFVCLYSADYTFKITIPESADIFQSDDVYPFVSIIDPAGNDTIIDNRGGEIDFEHSSGVKIKRSRSFFDVLFEIVLPEHLQKECVIWLSNSFSVDDLLPGSGQAGKSLPAVNISLYKNKTLIMTNNFDWRNRVVEITPANGDPVSIDVDSENCGLWKVCTIIPYHDRIKWDNEFFPRDRLITGKIWNSATKEPFAGASIFINWQKITESDEMGIYYVPYSFGTDNLSIHSEYERNKSEVVLLSGLHDERPRIVNLSISYQPVPPPPENFREIYYIYFAFNSFSIERNELNLSTLSQIERILRQYDIKGKIQIEGHTDSIGSKAYNYDLSFKRAGAVVNQLSKKGFRKDSFLIKGYGEDNPIATNETDEGRKQNRRVEIVFQYEK